MPPVAQPSTLTAPTQLHESAAARLRRQQREIQDNAKSALDSLTARMEALAQEAKDLADLANIFPKGVADALHQFANNTAGSVNAMQAGPVTLKR